MLYLSKLLCILISENVVKRIKYTLPVGQVTLHCEQCMSEIGLCRMFLFFSFCYLALYCITKYLAERSVLKDVGQVHRGPVEVGGAHTSGTNI